MLDIYDLLRAAEVPLDNHYSDLYFKATPEAMRVLREHRNVLGVRVSYFTSQIDGKLWGEIPFAFTPYWEARKVGTRA